MTLLGRLRRFADATRPVDPTVTRALAERWAELPAPLKTPAQMLGQRFLGCEGTHGVFPKCNLACTPCYHSRDANQVRIDVDHTLTRISEQMDYLRERRGPGQHAQLIGGEVTLLGAQGHGDALAVMEAHGRKPMSMSHGDFDYDYLVALAILPDGRRRFDHLSFAIHIDSTMSGRRGHRRPTSEVDLHPERERVCAMFARLRREHGVRSYLAHNMTVTATNLGEVADVVRTCRGMGFRMLSFQPAATIGHRLATDGPVSDEEVWKQIALGAQTRLPHGALQVGDPRCNRTVWGLERGGRYSPLLDDEHPGDLRARDTFLRAFPGVDFGGPRRAFAVRLMRVVARHPGVVPTAIGWAVRTARRIGPISLARGRVRPLTFVMHNFMDAEAVRPAWDLLQQGVTSDDPVIAATQERLLGCAYLMAHPERDLLVPACAQHAVFDPDENRALRDVLPLASNPRTTRVGQQ
jgi:hypothetical protein